MSSVDDLSRLPPPAVVETLDYEAILSALKADLIARAPELEPVLALESEPLVKLLQVAAWREMVLRQRVNDAAKSQLLAFADGADLDHLAAFYGVTRLAGESDDALRRRVRERIMGWSSAGGAEHYRYWALSASPEVADVAVDSPGPGRVRISVLPAGHGDAVPEALLQAVRDVVLRDDVRVLTDTVEVVPVELIPVTVRARIWLYPDTPLSVFDALSPGLRRAMAQAAGLGWDLTRSWLIAHLHQPGVHKVDLIEPASDVRVSSTQAVRLISDELIFAGRDR